MVETVVCNALFGVNPLILQQWAVGASKKVSNANMNPNPDKVRDNRLLDRDMVYLLWYQYNIR